MRNDSIETDTFEKCIEAIDKQALSTQNNIGYSKQCIDLGYGIFQVNELR